MTGLAISSSTESRYCAPGDAPLKFLVPAGKKDRIDLHFHPARCGIEDSNDIRFFEVHVLSREYRYTLSHFTVHFRFERLRFCEREIAPDHLLVFSNERGNPAPDQKRRVLDSPDSLYNTIRPFGYRSKEITADPARAGKYRIRLVL